MKAAMTDAVDNLLAIGIVRRGSHLNLLIFLNR